MRFICGPVPASRTFDPVAAGWTPLPESDSRRFMMVAMLSTIPFIAAAIMLILPVAPELRARMMLHPWSLPCFVLLMLALVPLHELIHAIAYGCGLRSPNLIAGFWAQRGIPYILLDEPLPRRRVLIMSAAPFCALTLLPLLAAPWFSEPWRSCILYFSFLHAALCVGDASTFLRLLREAPAKARIHNQGWQTYWGIEAGE